MNKYLVKIAQSSALRDFFGDEMHGGVGDKTIGAAGFAVPSLLMSHAMAKAKTDKGQAPKTKEIAGTNAASGAVEGALLALNHRAKSGPLGELKSWTGRAGKTGMGKRMGVYAGAMGAIDAATGAIESERMKHKLRRNS